MEVTSDTSSLQPGTKFADRYVIERLIGVGGMGEVYLALDTLLDNERIALKIIHIDLSTEEKNIKRFQREIQLTRKIAHENIARTYDAGIADNRFYFSMEYLEGIVLSEMISAGPIPAVDVCRIITQVCSGLSAIHKAGVVHRDLKPGNLILTASGQIKIMDFGIARPGNSNLTKTTEVLGSAPYMAPELWTGNEIGAQSDLYALGALFFELLTGVLPLDGETAAELMFKHLEIMPPPPSSVGENIPVCLDSVVLKLMNKSPQERYADADQVVAAVDMALSQGGVTAGSEEHTDPEVLAQDQLFSDSYPLLEQEGGSESVVVAQNSSRISFSAVGFVQGVLSILSSNVVAACAVIVLYLAIDRVLSPYLAEIYLKAQGPTLWYMRVFVTVGYLTTLGLFSSLPLLLVSSPLIRGGINPSLMLTIIARYSLIAGLVLTFNAVAFLALFRLDSQHSLGPYLLVILRQCISGVSQVFLLIPPLNWDNAVQMGGRLLVNAPASLAGTVFVMMVPLAAVAYGYYVGHVSGLLYKVHNRIIVRAVAALFASIVLAEMVVLYGFKIKSTGMHTLVRIGGMSLAYSPEQLFCGALNWLFLFMLVALVSRVSDRT